MKTPAYILEPVAFQRCKTVAHAIGDSIDSRHCKRTFRHIETDAVRALEAMQKRNDNGARSGTHIKQLKRAVLYRNLLQCRNDQFHQNFCVRARFKRRRGEPERQAEKLANAHDSVNRFTLLAAVQSIGKRLNGSGIHELLRCGYQIKPRLARCPFDQNPRVEVRRIQFRRTKPRPCIGHQKVETNPTHFYWPSSVMSAV